MGGLFALNAFISPGAQWAALGWGFGLAAHAMAVLRHGDERLDKRKKR